MADSIDVLVAAAPEFIGIQNASSARLVILSALDITELSPVLA
jgi:hypothetical protein